MKLVVSCVFWTLEVYGKKKKSARQGWFMAGFFEEMAKGVLLAAGNVGSRF